MLTSNLLRLLSVVGCIAASTDFMNETDRLFLLRVHICKWLLAAACRSMFIFKIAGRTFSPRPREIQLLTRTIGSLR